MMVIMEKQLELVLFFMQISKFNLLSIKTGTMVFNVPALITKYPKAYTEF